MRVRACVCMCAKESGGGGRGRARDGEGGKVRESKIEQARGIARAMSDTYRERDGQTERASK